MKSCVVTVAVWLAASASGPVAAQEWTAPEPECPGYDPEQDIVLIENGDRAPFSGLVFTDEAAACEFGRFELCERDCQLVLRARDEAHAIEIEAVKERRDIDLAALRDAHSIEIATKEAELELMEDELADALTTPWTQSFVFQFGAGVAVGAGIVILLAVLVN